MEEGGRARVRAGVMLGEAVAALLEARMGMVACTKEWTTALRTRLTVAPGETLVNTMVKLQPRPQRFRSETKHGPSVSVWIAGWERGTGDYGRSVTPAGNKLME